MTKKQLRKLGKPLGLPNMVNLVIKSHKNQKRKYIDEPYAAHPIRVALNARKYVRDNDLKKIISAIALGHDLFEDTDCKPTEIYEALVADEFQNRVHIEDVLYGINALTDLYIKETHPHLNRAERKNKEITRAMLLFTLPIAIVKACDNLDNFKSVVEHDKVFARVYHKELKDLFFNVLSDRIPKKLRNKLAWKLYSYEKSIEGIR